MKPDPDMMRQVLHRSRDALEVIARFQSSAGFAFGCDATHAGAYQRARDFADALQSIGAQVHRDLLEVDERLTPAIRITKEPSG